MESVELLFEQHKNLIQKTIWRNRPLLSALQLEDEDVAQQLAIALLLAIRCFDPDRSESLTAYIRHSLQYEILNIKRRFKPHGVTGVPKGRRVDFLYFDNVLTGDRAYELPSDDDISSFEVSALFEHLTAKETEAVRLKVYGFPVGRKVHTAVLAGVGRRYMERRGKKTDRAKDNREIEVTNRARAQERESRNHEQSRGLDMDW